MMRPEDATSWTARRPNASRGLERAARRSSASTAASARADARDIERMPRPQAALSAQPNAASRESKTQHLSVLARVHGFLRAPVHPATIRVSAVCGRLRAHRQIKLPCALARRRAPSTALAAADRAERAAAAGPPSHQRARVPRERKSRLAHAMASGTFVVAVELLPRAASVRRRSSGRAR